MYLKSIHLQNIKSFQDSGVIEFSPSINLLVGPNNAGKSIITHSIASLQPLPNHPDSLAFVSQNVRRASPLSNLIVILQDPNRLQMKIPPDWDIKNWQPRLTFQKAANVEQSVIMAPNGNEQPFPRPTFQQQRPNNFLYTYLSRRKPNALNATITLANAQTLEEAIQHLPSKIDFIRDSRYADVFNNICQQALGFTVTCKQSADGKQPGLVLSDDSLIPIIKMGEGVVNLLYLVHLTVASKNLFIIEEIENDLHPTALKSLLDSIIVKSKDNQFIISTHSNIVVRHLGATPGTRLFSIQMKLAEDTRIPTSTCQQLSDTAEERIELLESLGYEPYDFGFCKGYLILEESSAESLIKNFLIPFLVPRLQGKLKTIAAQGVDDVKARLSDLMRLFVYVHITPQFKDKAWVAVDGGAHGKNVVTELKTEFKTWPEQHFRCFKEENIERYYPKQFEERVNHVLLLSNGRDKRAQKKALIMDVLQWAMEDVERAKVTFQDSAAELLVFLREIDTALN
jgi:predicted ATPase